MNWIASSPVRLESPTIGTRRTNRRAPPPGSRRERHRARYRRRWVPRIGNRAATRPAAAVLFERVAGGARRRGPLTYRILVAARRAAGRGLVRRAHGSFRARRAARAA